MADDDVEEKKFDPSGRRLQQLRRQGQVAKSQDFVAATSLAVLVIYLMFNFSAFRDAFAAALTLVPMENGTDFLSRAILTLSGVGTLFIQTIGPVFAVAFFGYVAAYAFDAKGIPIATNQLAPNISRVNPVEGVKNLFRKDALVELAKGLVKIALMAIGVWYVFK